MKHIASTVLLLSLPSLVFACDNSASDLAVATVSIATPAVATNIADLPSPWPSTTLSMANPAAVDPVEQTIYASFMSDAEGATTIIRADTFPDTYPRSEEEARQFISANLPSVSSETLENYIYVNSTSSQLPSSMNLGVDYILISTPEFLQITSSPDWQNAWRQRFPNSELGCIAFSRIGFNDSRTQALLYVARLWVGGGYYLMEHNAQNGVWEITARFDNVITD